ncbi:MAG: hypothetical protein N4A62_00720 [Marinisporobacter sp.]|jgi:hypothetical protein|nr:hypothetical protein [Marinisporobacter sp.]
MKFKIDQKGMLKIVCIVLLITFIISFALSMKYVEDKVYAIIAHSILVMVWSIILMIPKSIFNMLQTMFSVGKNRELYKFEILIYRVIAVYCMLSTLLYIRYLWIYG